jgi:hypothetical protein
MRNKGRHYTMTSTVERKRTLIDAERASRAA